MTSIHHTIEDAEAAELEFMKECLTENDIECEDRDDSVAGRFLTSCEVAEKFQDLDGYLCCIDISFIPEEKHD